MLTDTEAAGRSAASTGERRRVTRDPGEDPFPGGCEGAGQAVPGHPVPGAAGVPGGQHLQDRRPSGLQSGGGGADGGHPPGVRHVEGPAGVRRGPPVLCPQGPHGEAGAVLHPPAAGRPLRIPQAPRERPRRLYRRTCLQLGLCGPWDGKGEDLTGPGLLCAGADRGRGPHGGPCL